MVSTRPVALHSKRRGELFLKVCLERRRRRGMTPYGGTPVAKRRKMRTLGVGNRNATNVLQGIELLGSMSHRNHPHVMFFVALCIQNAM